MKNPRYHSSCAKRATSRLQQALCTDVAYTEETTRLRFPLSNSEVKGHDILRSWLAPPASSLHASGYPPSSSWLLGHIVHPGRTFVNTQSAISSKNPHRESGADFRKRQLILRQQPASSRRCSAADSARCQRWPRRPRRELPFRRRECYRQRHSCRRCQ